MSLPPPQSSLRAVSLVTALALVQLLVQFATQLVLAKVFGAAGEMDAFVAALAPPTTIALILAGSLGYVLIPLAAERLAGHGQLDADSLTSQIGMYLAGLSLILSLAVALAAGPLIAALCPGFAASQRELAAALLQILAWLILANSLISFLNAGFHCRGQFALPAAAGVAGTLVTLGYVLALHKQQGIHAVAFGVLAGAVVTVVILLPLFVTRLGPARLKLATPHPAARRALALLTPLVLGSLVWRLDPIVDRFLGSYLPTGSLAHLGYAWRLTAALFTLAASGLGVVAFPAIAAHAAAGRREQLNREVAHGIRFLLVLLVPVCLGLAVFSQPVVRLLFERGKFAAGDTQQVALLVALYLGYVAGGSLGDLLSRTLYALHDTRTPVIVGLAGFALGVMTKFVLVGPFGAAGLVVGTSLWYLLNTAVLTAVLLPRLGSDMLGGVPGCLARAALCAAAGCLAALATGWAFTPFAVLPAAIAGAAVYVLALWLCGDEFARRLIPTTMSGR